MPSLVETHRVEAMIRFFAISRVNFCISITILPLMILPIHCQCQHVSIYLRYCFGINRLGYTSDKGDSHQKNLLIFEILVFIRKNLIRVKKSTHKNFCLCHFCCNYFRFNITDVFGSIYSSRLNLFDSCIIIYNIKSEMQKIPQKLQKSRSTNSFTHKGS